MNHIIRESSALKIVIGQNAKVDCHAMCKLQTAIMYVRFEFEPCQARQLVAA